MGMRIQIASKSSSAILEYYFNSRGYRANWQAHGIYFILALDVLHYILDKNEGN
jgi:hypothetical protein